MGTDLRVTVDDEFPDIPNGKGLLLARRIRDRQRFSRPPDTGAMRRDVHGLAITISREESDRLPFLVFRQPFFLGQADRSEGTPQTQPIVCRHGRAFNRPAEFPGADDRLPNVRPGFCIDENPHRRIRGVIPDTGFPDRRSGVLFQKEGIGANLKAVTPPCVRAVVTFGGAAPLVFVGKKLPVPTAQAIDLSANAERLAFQDQTDDLAFVGRQLFMEPAARVHRGVRNPNFLDLFQVEKPLTVRQGVQRHDTNERFSARIG